MASRPTTTDAALAADTLQRSGPPGSAPPAENVRQPTPDVLPEADRTGRARKSLTIGSVSKLLKGEFPDISISKIRYLEDQKLLAPRRTRGGYRLYSPADVSRLRTILRLQRDEFLPLRVIRQELAAGRTVEDIEAAGGSRTPQRSMLSASSEDAHTLEELIEYAGVDERLVRELEDYGVIKGVLREGGRLYDDVDREIVRAVGELTRYGVAPRNLKVFRTSADREAALLEQILGPALRSRNRDRRDEAIEALENLASVVSRLKHLLLVRDLRGLV
jgi:DNA-binding transcriptional MerR regulator